MQYVRTLTASLLALGILLTLAVLVRAETAPPNIDPAVKAYIDQTVHAEVVAAIKAEIINQQPTAAAPTATQAPAPGATGTIDSPIHLTAGQAVPIGVWYTTDGMQDGACGSAGGYYTTGGAGACGASGSGSCGASGSGSGSCGSSGGRAGLFGRRRR